MQKFNLKRAEPTIRPAPEPWKPAEDAAVLMAAMKGFGTDEKAIWSLLTTRSNKQRQEIAAAYSAEYQTSLLADLKSELSFNFKGVIVALMQTPTVFACSEFNRALTTWLKIDSNTIDELVVTRSNAEIKELAQTYQTLYKRPLVEHVCDATGHEYRQLLTIILTCSRASKVDKTRVGELVEKLFEAGEGRWGTDETEFVNIFGRESYEQLALVFEAYKEDKGRTIEQVLEEEMPREHLLPISMAIVDVIKDIRAYYAKQLHKAMDGLGTDDATLIRILVSRSEIDLEDIKREYERLYNKTLASDVESETSGDYRDALLSIIKGNSTRADTRK